jgi:hypothetical protein
MELYNLDADPSEQRNIAAKEPQIVGRFAAIMAKEHVPSQLFPMKGLDTAPTKAGD